MNNIHRRLALLFFLFLLFGYSHLAHAEQKLVKGIYLTQTTLEDTRYLTYLIEHSKAVGITTFVVDMEKPSKKYEKNIALLKNNDIRYVARIIVFPEGGKPEQISSTAYWEKRYRLVEAAIGYGAQEIQLDYIRYNTRQQASAENAKNIFKVVEFFKERVGARGIPLQVDVFGISSFGESKHIGQNIRLLAKSVDAMCPMVYPSHFEPFREHAVTPYKTIYTSLKAFHKQFDGKVPFKLYAFIEISNYRYPLPGAKRRAYVVAEMKAVEDAGADGWYVWSAHNKYDYLFSLLGQLAAEEKSSPEKTMLVDKTENANEKILAENNAITPNTEAAPKSNVPRYILEDERLALLKNKEINSEIAAEEANAKLELSKSDSTRTPTKIEPAKTAEKNAAVQPLQNEKMHSEVEHPKINTFRVELSKNTGMNPLASKLPLLEHFLRTKL